MNKPDKLVIFDYSGTLSLEAPQFGRSENLLAAFAKSGLSALGVTTPALFWHEIVGPTWIEGSTTGIGYKGVLAERIMALGIAPGKSGAEIAAAAALFVEAYLDGSPIDPHWRPLLEALTLRSDMALVVATDHYAEMTETILRNFRTWNIPAQKAGAGTRPQGQQPAPFCIANSADMGFWKADRRFWAALKSQLALDQVRDLLIIDDFGFNEEMEDLYAAEGLVEARRKETITVLKEVFGATVRAIPFLLKGEERRGAARRIAETGEEIINDWGDAERIG